MSHFLDRLTYFTREQPEFSDTVVAGDLADNASKGHDER